MNYYNSDIDPTIIKYTYYKNDLSCNSDLFPSTTKNEHLGLEYIHEHFFKIYDPFQLDHSCSKDLLIRCITCSDIFCNGCGKRVIHS